MSLVTEILDRLTGIAVVREKLSETGQRVNKLTDALIDHERRLVRLETIVLSPMPPSRALPKKK
jgi:hypothetical protein